MIKTIHSREYQRLIEKLKRARIEAGLRQIDVAKILNRPQSYIARVESGDYRLDILEVKKFAKIYKRDIRSFLE